MSVAGSKFHSSTGTKTPFWVEDVIRHTRHIGTSGCSGPCREDTAHWRCKLIRTYRVIRFMPTHAIIDAHAFDQNLSSEMLKLEDIIKGAQIRGLEPDEIIRIVTVEPVWR